MMSNGRHMALYDTTLRDGMQMEGMSVSVAEKIRIALRLADLGIDYIEGGFPGSNPRTRSSSGRWRRSHLGKRAWRLSVPRGPLVSLRRRTKYCAPWRIRISLCFASWGRLGISTWRKYSEWTGKRIYA